jgi:hypothetical protein
MGLGAEGMRREMEAQADRYKMNTRNTGVSFIDGGIH